MGWMAINYTASSFVIFFFSTFIIPPPHLLSPSKFLKIPTFRGMSTPEKKLFLLDAYALIYRAHFAFSKTPRINSKGLNTGVMFGFTNTLLEVLQKQKPTHIAVAFDTSVPTFRHVEFPAYKAQRQETPEDIRAAVPWVKQIVKAFNIPVLELDGFEADDIIGTFAIQAADKGFEVFMMTPDKDYGQIVREHVYLYKPAFMGNGVDVMGVKEVLEKWGIERVDQVADMLGLQGDASDNIPGIPGIGPKTATALLKQYGTVENLVAHAHELKGKQRENVENFGEQGILSKKLATIHTEVPLEFMEQDLTVDEPDAEKLKAIFTELEFRTLMKRVLGEEEKGKVKIATETQLSIFDTPAEPSAEEALPTPADKATIHTTPHDYYLTDTEDLMQELVEFLSIQEEVCFDTETTSVDAFEAELVGLAFSYKKGEAYYVPVPADAQKAQAIVEIFRPVLENEKIRLVGQNLKYDILVMRKYGVNIRGPIFDTMLAHYLIDPETRHNMDVLAENYLQYTPVSITELIGEKGKRQGNMRDVDPARVAEYAGEDADITLQLKHALSQEVDKHRMNKLLEEIELPLVPVLASMEFEGVKVDTATLKDLSKEFEKKALKAQEEIFELAGGEFNVASPKQLGEILFDKLKLIDKPKKTKTGQYATGEEILSKLAAEHPIANKILEFREYQKLKSTYVDSLPLLISERDGRIHTDYRQAVAATGRLSSNNPNLQNIPIRTENGRSIRKAFIPRSEEFVLLSADYSQIELRIVAAFAKDESMMEAFRQGRDIHATTASKVFGVPLDEVEPAMRRKAKEVNFGIIYGISAFGLAQNLNISRTEAAEIIESYFREFPGIKRYMDESIQTAREKEYVETLFGRRRYLRDINSRNLTMRGFAERNAINAPIQGSAADIIKIAMIRIHDWMEKENLRSRMIMQVHDELVFDVHKEEQEKVREKVIELMKHAVALEVPMEVEAGFGSNWLEAH
jgi:DNA polymerase I